MTRKQKVVFIGIDACDKDLVLHWAKSGALPVFQSLLKKGLSGITTNPPGLFVGAVWPSFYTGASPANHGRYCYKQFKSGTYESYSTKTASFLKKEPFWNALSRAERRVAIIDFPHTYPEKLNGVQIVEWGCHDAGHGLRSWPASLAHQIEQKFGKHPVPPRCDAIRGPEELRVLHRQLLDGVRKKAMLNEYILQQESWDLFATVFSESHCVGHQCWRLHDKDHILYDEKSVRFIGSDPVKDVYMAIDSALGSLIDKIGQETILIILCSHGMGPHYDGNHMLDDILIALENPDTYKIRKNSNTFWSKYWNWIPGLRAHHSASLRNNRFAERNCFQIPNNTVAGGIRVNMAGREPGGKIHSGSEYEEFCLTLTHNLLDLINADSGEPAVREIYKVADRYSGEYLDELPDLIVEWNRSRPIESIHSPKFGMIHKKFKGCRSGDHRPDGMFIASGPSIKAGHIERQVPVTDFAPTIASFLGVTLTGVDGTVIHEIL